MRAGLVFTAERLPALPAGKVYQLWTITGTTATGAGDVHAGCNWRRIRQRPGPSRRRPSRRVRRHDRARRRIGHAIDADRATGRR